MYLPRLARYSIPLHTGQSNPLIVSGPDSNIAESIAPFTMPELVEALVG